MFSDSQKKKKKNENSGNWYIPIKTICLKELSKVIIGKYYVR